MANPRGHTTDSGARAGRRRGLRGPARKAKPPIPRPTAFPPASPPSLPENNHGWARRVNPGASLSSDGPDIVGFAPRDENGRSGCADNGAPFPAAASCGRRGGSLRRNRSDLGRNDCKSAPAGGKGRTGRNDRRRRHPDRNRPRKARERVDAIHVRRHDVPAIVLRRDGGRGAEATCRLGRRRAWLMIGDCSARGEDLSAISPRPDLIKPPPAGCPDGSTGTSRPLRFAER